LWRIIVDSELLIVFAEVAVAFAGFASLVSILGQREAVDHPMVLSARMRTMLVTSLLVTGFALLPLVVSWYGLDPWRISTIAMLVTVAVYLVWILTIFRALRAEVPANWLQRRVILPTLNLTFLALAVLLVLNTVLLSPGVYATTLAILLFQGGFAFSLIVFSFLPQLPGASTRTPTPDPPDESR
jgi:hypothetical protein